jgi:nitrogen fixation protein FixH
MLHAAWWLLLGVMLVGCAQTQAADGQITLNVAEKTVGTTQVDVTIADAQGRPVSGAAVQLRGDMTHAGMQPVITTLDDLGKGQYRATDFQFSMAGDWVLTVQAKMPDGASMERMFEMRGITD